MYNTKNRYEQGQALRKRNIYVYCQLYQTGIDDSAEDMQVTRNGCRKMLKQFDALTENIRRAVGWEN